MAKGDITKNGESNARDNGKSRRNWVLERCIYGAGLATIGGVLIMRLVVFEGYGKRGAQLLQVSIEDFLHSGLLSFEG